ncbi:hypothetical protein PENTCL1PPCAC_20646, partial [Pristionchus entomophagus]
IDIIQMKLIEWDTAGKKQQLHQLLRTEDGMGGIPYNHVTDAAIRISLENEFPMFRVRFFSTDWKPETTPTYVFVVQETSKIIVCYARPPTRGHDAILLQSALGELVNLFFGQLDSDGETIFSMDSFTNRMLSEVMTARRGFDVSALSTCDHFYMTNETMQMIEQVEYPPIDGFHVDSVDIERDSLRIYDNWKFSPSLDETKAYLRDLPSLVARSSSSGEAVSWGMVTPFGWSTNLFTLPDFRGTGVSEFLGWHLCRRIIRQGLRPFMFVEIGNSAMLAAMKKKAVWKRWDTANGDGFPIHFSSIKRRIGTTPSTVHPRANI